MIKRRRFKQVDSLHNRLAAFSADMIAQAAATDSDPERENLLKRARQADIAVEFDEWAKLPVVQLTK